MHNEARPMDAPALTLAVCKLRYTAARAHKSKSKSLGRRYITWCAGLPALQGAISSLPLPALLLQQVGHRMLQHCRWPHGRHPVRQVGGQQAHAVDFVHRKGLQRRGDAHGTRLDSSKTG